MGSVLAVSKSWFDSQPTHYFKPVYEGNDKQGHSKKLYLNELAVMSEKQLIVETGDATFICIFLIDKPWLDWHWRLIACADEWTQRHTNRYMDCVNEIYNEEFGALEYE